MALGEECRERGSWDGLEGWGQEGGRDVGGGQRVEVLRAEQVAEVDGGGVDAVSGG